MDAVLVDLSGTLHVDDVTTPNAVAALERLQASGKKIKYVTNTTKEPLRLLHERLTSLGFSMSQSDIFTSMTAARRYVESRQLRPLLLLEDTAKEDFTGVDTMNPNAVVVGLAPPQFDYQHMNDAFRLILNGAPLIAIHKARYFRRKDGLALGPGPFVSALEYAADVTATVVGKPQKSFFLDAIHDLNVEPRRTVMIGDDVRDDVAGALNAGMMAILVRTGKYRHGDENSIQPSPSYVCDDFASAVELLLDNY